MIQSHRCQKDCGLFVCELLVLLVPCEAILTCEQCIEGVNTSRRFLLSMASKAFLLARRWLIGWFEIQYVSVQCVYIVYHCFHLFSIPVWALTPRTLFLSLYLPFRQSNLVLVEMSRLLSLICKFAVYVQAGRKRKQRLSVSLVQFSLGA